MTELYKEKINLVVDYIQRNLDNSLSLRELSKIACLSPFHFNRIFKNVIGETLYQYIKRLRLEKSAGLLLSNPKITVTEIALTCAFETSASFSKSFKKHFKMTPTEWRNQSTNDITKAKIWDGKFSIIDNLPVWTFKHNNSIRQVKVEDISPFKVAYIRSIGSYKEDPKLFRELSNKLYKWAIPRGQVNEQTYVLNIYFDDPEITEALNHRVMVAIPISEKVNPSGSVGITEFTGGKYAVCRFLLRDDEFQEAWDWIASIWLPKSGYEWDDREAFERCLGEETVSSKTVFDVEIGIPIKVK